MTEWAVGKVQTGDEPAVEEKLRLEGCEVYCPQYTWITKSRRQPKPIKRTTAILPGYLFVNPQSIVNLETILRWPTFHYFIRFGEYDWSLLHDEALEGLRLLEACKVLEAPEKVATPFAVGTVLRVDGGPFGGMVGKAMFVIPGRVILMGRDFTVPTDMPSEMLQLDGG